MTMQTCELLEGAADKIERDGWANADGFRAGPESSCVHTAIGACGERMDCSYNKALDAFAAAVGGPEAAGRCAPIWAWNDAPGRTAAEVIAMLRAVAASEKARAQQTEPARESVPA